MPKPEQFPETFIAECQGFLDKSQILTSGSELEAYLVDERRLFSGQALCLLYPETTGQVQSIINTAIKTGVAVIAVGGNTGLCGGATPPSHGHTALCSLKNMRSVLNLDPSAQTMTLQAGITVKEAARAAESVGLFFPLQFGAEETAHIGGAVATNAGGYSTLRYGNTRDLLLGVEAVMADGSVLNQLKTLRKDNTGYNLSGLLCGSEGTLGIITAAVFKLFPAPTDIQTTLISVANPEAAVQLLNIFRAESDGRLSAFEWINQTASEIATKVEGVSNPFKASGEKAGELVLVELASCVASHVSSRGEMGEENMPGLEYVMEKALGKASQVGLIMDAIIADSKSRAESFWKLREAVPQGEKLAGGSIKHDISVPISSIPSFLAKAEVALGDDLLFGALFVAYGHLGDGNIHYNLIAKEGSIPVDDSFAQYGTQKIFDIVEELGGSFSAEHGIGQLRVEELQRRGDEGSLSAMKKIKAALDPQNILNPHKVL